MHMLDPTFPPLLSGHDVKGKESAFENACARAGRGELGAGDVVWSRNAMRLDLAIVLEPEIAFERAVQVLPLAMVAAGDSIGSLSPPQVGIEFTWPNVVRINGARAGGLRAAVPGSPEPGDVPDWMVVGLLIRHRRAPSDPEPGMVPDQTWLAEEGGGELTRTDLIESYCRHFLTWIHGWREDGFRAVHDSWLYRAAERGGQISVEQPGGDTVTGAFLGIDDNGNLLVKDAGDQVRSVYLADFVERYEGGGAA